MTKKFLVASGLLALALGAQASAADQASYATPQQAVDALISANRSGNEQALLKVLGPDAGKLVDSGDEAADKANRQKFIAAYDTSHRLVRDGDGKETLILGRNGWPMPIPLVREDGTWHFDTDAGMQEILDRRIGRNETEVMQVCESYVEAQREYAEASDHRTYAQRFMSHDDEHDGLYWPVAAGEPESPLGPLMASAEAEGYDTSGGSLKHEPFHGYYYRILTAQGEHAEGGAMDYIEHGRMTRGFALIAYPASYGDSGIMTFIVNQDGIIHEKDLGPRTADKVADIHSYDPDDSWKLP